MGEMVCHPREVLDALDIGDEVRAQVGAAAEFKGEVVDGNDTRREATPQSVGVDVKWDDSTMVSHGWRFTSSRGWIRACCDYDGKWVIEVTVVAADRTETYLVDDFEVVRE